MPVVLNYVRVFLSSTYQDLVEERTAVHEALAAAGYEVVRMEDFGSRGEVPLETCLDAVASCEAYVLILARRYGSLAPGVGFSYTEAEYEWARELGIYVLAYVIEGIETVEDSAADPIRLHDFYRKLREEHTVSTWINKDDLAVQVARDLDARRDRLIRRPAFGKLNRAIAKTDPYAVKSYRHTRLKLKPLVAVIADLGVLTERDYPERRGRRIRVKVRDAIDFLDYQGASVTIFNAIPAPGDTPIVQQRISEVKQLVGIVVCFAQGDSDVREVVKFIDGDVKVVLWYPERVELPPLPENVRAEAYRAEDLQSCNLALHVREYLDQVLDSHVVKSLT